jgi:hypothetical protein
MSTWFILWSLEIFYGHWKYFMAIWYILRSFGIFFPVLVCCTQKKSGNPGHQQADRLTVGGLSNKFPKRFFRCVGRRGMTVPKTSRVAG